MTDLLLVLFLPWGVGYLAVAGLSRHETIPALPASLLLGYGYLLGIFGTTLLLRCWDAMGLRLAFTPIVVLLIGWGLLTVVLQRSQLIHWQRRPSFSCDYRTLLILLLLAGLTLRLWILGHEIWLRPLFPWDAWSAWAQKTAVWFDLRTLVPFVDPIRWPGTENSPQFTANAFAYPTTLPLIQVWTLLGLGQWDDARMNLPWLFCWIALGLAVYGQCRYWGISALIALLGVYGLLSLPLLETHVALAGYADLWLATSYGLAFIALLQWLRSGEQRQLILAILCAVIATQLKNEGWIWALTLMPAVLIGLKRYWTLGGLVIIALGLPLIAYWLAPLHFTIPGLGPLLIQPYQLQIPGFGLIALGYHPIGTPLLQHLWVLGNWNLFWYLTLGALLFGISRLKHHAVLRIAYLTLAISAAWILGMFFFTDLGRWAEQATALNRVLLHAVPGLLFVSLVSLHAGVPAPLCVPPELPTVE